jgi:hypothetical protein
MRWNLWENADSADNERKGLLASVDAFRIFGIACDPSMCFD